MTAPGARIDWSALASPVARALLGEPNARTSTACELRYGRKGSLAVHVAGERAGTWFDHEAGEGGGVLALVMRERHCEKAAAFAWLREARFVERGPGRPEEDGSGVAAMRPASRGGHDTAPGNRPGARPADTRPMARRVWNATRPLAGTLAETYLAARRVGHVASVPALRFSVALSHPTAPGGFPALVAGVQDADGGFLGVQRTFLRADGSAKADVDPPRASLGSLAGGAVRLVEPEAGRLLLGEGIKTTAAAMALFGLPGWAALSTSGLRAVELPAYVRDVLITADRDAKGGGQLAGAALAKRLEGEGRRVEIRLPPFVGDWCDVLKLAKDAA